MRSACSFPLFALVLSACTVATPSSSESPGESTAPLAALSPDAGDAVAWTNLVFDGRDCAELFPPSVVTFGADASFLPGFGTHVAARARAERHCAMRGTLVVPAGSYVTSLTYTLGYGGVKPAGARFAIDGDAHLFTPHGRVDVDVAPPEDVAFDDAFAEVTVVRDVRASREELCERGRERESRRAARVGFESWVDLRYEAGDADGVLDVDSVDVHADVAPCPSRDPE